jgi:hypothetical protein
MFTIASFEKWLVKGKSQNNWEQLL